MKTIYDINIKSYWRNQYYRYKKLSLSRGKCKQCEKSFSYFNKRGQRKFCSLRCSAKYQWENSEYRIDIKNETSDMWKWYWEIELNKKQLPHGMKEVYDQYKNKMHNETFVNNKSK